MLRDRPSAAGAATVHEIDGDVREVRENRMADKSWERTGRPELPEVEPGAGFSQLAGVRVLDLSTSIAGPYAGMLLGDLGANVVKVERSGGDDARAWGPPFLDGESLWFLSVNRNKRSVFLDYASPPGAAVLRRLIEKADVLLVNQPRRVLEKLGLAPDALTRSFPRLVYVAVTGFGLAGERADRTCYDLIAEGWSGVMDLTGPADGEPQRIGAPAADMLAGQDAALAATAALLERERTGRGRIVDIALVDSMTRFLTCRIVPYLGSGEVPRRSGGKDSVLAIYQAFETADEPITLALGNDNIWRRFWAAVDDAAFGDDPGFATNAMRRARREEIVARIQSIFLTQPRDHWLEAFRAARVPAGPINRIDEAVADPELRRRGLFYNLRTERGLIPLVGTGFQIDGRANVPRLPPPRLGEHTAEVLEEWIGLDRQGLQELLDADDA
jgi:crotonobetainyl-CoA:carnitine CoA-transferase CaiB-like acyl-CoA transferase